MRPLVLAATVVVALFGAAHAGAATFYVSPSGSDANAGTSSAAPWRTVGKVNATALAPGDTVLFKGGATFTDSTLMPSTSGTAAAPITFSSYGAGHATISNGRGAVWVSGRSYLVFDSLTLTTGGAPYNIFGGDAGSSSSHVTLRNSTITNGGATGIISPSHGDSYWSILGNTVTNTGDSAIIVLGSSCTVSGNTISNPGTNPSVTWSTHGIYAKGADMTIADNDISHVPNGQAVSIRFHGARVYGNLIHDTPYAFAFFDYDTAAAPQGTSYIYDNRAWNISGYGFYYDGYLDPQGHAPTVDFVVASNTFLFSNASEAVNVSPSGSAHVRLANNIFAGSYGSALRGAPTTTEDHDDWYGGSSNVPSGSGDLRVAPSLGAAPGLALPSSSRLVDAGTTSVGVSYASTCDGSPLSYCGAAPDLGAVESGTAPAPAPAPAPGAPAPATDTTPPTGTLLSPAASATVPTTFTASATASDNGGSGVASLVFYLDGAKICTVSTATTYSCRYTASAGTHNISIAMIDKAGNTGWLGETVTVAAPVVVDTTPPTGQLLSPAASATVPLTFTVSATATDSGSGVARLVFYLDGSTICTVSTATTYSCTYTASAGTHNISIAMIDKAGNTGWLGETVTAAQRTVYASVRTAATARPAAKHRLARSHHRAKHGRRVKRAPRRG